MIYIVSRRRFLVSGLNAAGICNLPVSTQMKMVPSGVMVSRLLSCIAHHSACSLGFSNKCHRQAKRWSNSQSSAVVATRESVSAKQDCISTHSLLERSGDKPVLAADTRAKGQLLPKAHKCAWQRGDMPGSGDLKRKVLFYHELSPGSTGHWSRPL